MIEIIVQLYQKRKKDKSNLIMETVIISFTMYQFIFLNIIITIWMIKNGIKIVFPERRIFIVSAMQSCSFKSPSCLLFFNTIVPSSGIFGRDFCFLRWTPFNREDTKMAYQSLKIRLSMWRTPGESEALMGISGGPIQVG